jgi:hypothetical protein
MLPNWRIKMPQIGSSALLLALACFACSIVASVIALTRKKHVSTYSVEVARPARIITFALIVPLLASFAAAQTLTGTVKNSTSGKPSAGDEIVIFNLKDGMKELGRTTTDARGRFNFKLDDAQKPHLVLASHQGVTYHRVTRPGTSSLGIEVYDVATKVNGIGVVDMMRIQAAQGQITVTRDFGVRNASHPPRTQVSERSLEFYIPDGAHIMENSGAAIVENGVPMKAAPVLAGDKNRYSFTFPLRPGLTRFQVTYQLPYGGSANLDPKSVYPLEYFMIMLPKSMQFRAADSSAGFKMINLPSVPDATVQVAANISHGQTLAFDVSGEGTLKTGGQGGGQDSAQPKESSSVTAPASQPNNGSGAELAPPVHAHSLQQKYRWWILGSFAAILIFSGVWIAWRQQSRTRVFRRQTAGVSWPTIVQEEADYGPPVTGMSKPKNAPVSAPTSSELMARVKDQLFSIEVERQSGKISQAEFDKARTAIDQMLESALKGEARSA